MLGQGDRFLQRDEHIDHAMLQHLKRSERDAELLASLGVFKGCGIQLGHRADGFGAKRGDGAVAACLQDGDTLALLAQHPAGRDPHASTIVSKYGSTTRLRPNSCIMIMLASGPAPRPPSSSGNGAASRPSSAKASQCFRLQPSSVAMILRRVSKSYRSRSNR